jgi:hypothetical protein
MIPGESSGEAPNDESRLLQMGKETMQLRFL